MGTPVGDCARGRRAAAAFAVAPGRFVSGVAIAVGESAWASEDFKPLIDF